jgi:hypothetical protein
MVKCPVPPLSPDPGSASGNEKALNNLEHFSINRVLDGSKSSSGY